MTFNLNLPFAGPPPRYVDVTVGPPWNISVLNGPVGSDYFCPGTVVQAGCTWVTEPETIMVWTNDPDAPARNITIAAASQPCP
jgi:hypothetical protein